MSASKRRSKATVGVGRAGYSCIHNRGSGLVARNATRESSIGALGCRTWSGCRWLPTISPSRLRRTEPGSCLECAARMARSDSPRDCWIKPMRSPLAGTEDGVDAFFSPDGQWVGFFADGKMKKVSVHGGSPVTLCDAPSPHGASWGEDGNIVCGTRCHSRPRDECPPPEGRHRP